MKSFTVSADNAEPKLFPVKNIHLLQNLNKVH